MWHSYRETALRALWAMEGSKCNWGRTTITPSISGGEIVVRPYFSLIANVIAWPIAYYEMNLWLQNFVYRINLAPLIFIGSGLIALCIAWVSVGGTAAKAASQKPVLALRYE